MESLPPSLRWYLLCFLSGLILFIPLLGFHWMELICSEMMEFHLGPWWVRDCSFLLNLFLSFNSIGWIKWTFLIWNFLFLSVLLSKPMIIVWFGKCHPLLFDWFLCQRIIIFFKCLIVPTNDSCLVGVFYVYIIIVLSNVVFFYQPSQ